MFLGILRVIIGHSRNRRLQIHKAVSCMYTPRVAALCIWDTNRLETLLGSLPSLAVCPCGAPLQINPGRHELIARRASHEISGTLSQTEYLLLPQAELLQAFHVMRISWRGRAVVVVRVLFAAFFFVVFLVFFVIVRDFLLGVIVLVFVISVVHLLRLVST